MQVDSAHIRLLEDINDLLDDSVGNRRYQLRRSTGTLDWYLGGRLQHVALYGDENTFGWEGTFIEADAVKFVPTFAPENTFNVRYIVGDHLGTPQVALDDSGTIVWKAAYEPFGDAVVDEDPDGDLDNYTLNLRFPGQYYDAESRLHYNYFRDYDPSLGRYIESDPIGLYGGPNVFEYALSNPILLIDQFGLCVLSNKVSKCLEEVFGESVSGVEIKSRVGDNLITTRPNAIYLPQEFSCEAFQSDANLLLHEFYHVLRQWNTGELTRTKYLVEYIRHGMLEENKYEAPAYEFARENSPKFKECMSCDDN